MYQDLTSVYGEQCSTPPVTQQSSFENEDSYHTQVLRPYSYAPSDLRVHPQIYSTPSIGFDNQDLRHIVPAQQVTAMPSIQENPQLASHDLNTIASRRDLQWLTTTSTNMRTQSPFSTSSPRPPVPSLYPSQPTPPNISLNPQNSFDEPLSAGASLSHHQFAPPAYSAANLPSSTSRSQKAKKASSSNPTKPKGTPGRKRKFQDHELTPEEATKRRIRRERNKVAAAKCRNRRRELTDRLQGETDQLEDHRNFLQQEVMSLQQEKEHLEFILAAHSPNCKARIMTEESASLQGNDARPVDERISNLSYSSSSLPVMDDVMGVTVSDSNYFYLPPGQSSYQSPSVSTSCTDVAPKDSKFESYVKVESSPELENPPLFQADNLPTDLSSRPTTLSSSSKLSTRPPRIELENVIENQDTLNTPVCTLATPSLSSAGVFSFPLTPNACSTLTEPVFSYQGPAITNVKEPQLSRGPTFTAPITSHSATSYSRSGLVPFEPCALAHRRRSSSDSHNSVDSANSHHFVTL